jgi:hypothetical protein
MKSKISILAFVAMILAGNLHAQIPICGQTVESVTVNYAGPTFPVSHGCILPDTGVVRAYFVFARFKDDTTSDAEWPLNSLPNWATNFISSQRGGNYPSGGLSKKFFDFSAGAFHLIGDCFPRVVVTSRNCSEYDALQYGVLNREILDTVDQSVDFSQYDAINHIADRNNIPGTDGKVDLLIMIYRRTPTSSHPFKAWGVTDLGFGTYQTNDGTTIINGTADEGGGVTLVRNPGSGELTTFEDAVNLAVHEVGHKLIGMVHLTSNFAGLGAMSGQGGGGTFNSVERRWLGWGPDFIYKSSNPMTVTLRDFFTTGDAFAVNTLAYRWIILENRRKLVADDRAKAVGLYAYLYDYQGEDNLQVLSADGKWNWEYDYNTSNVRKVSANPTGGQSKLEKIVINEIAYRPTGFEGDTLDAFNIGYRVLLSDSSNPGTYTHAGVLTHTRIELLQNSNGVMTLSVLQAPSTELILPVDHATNQIQSPTLSWNADGASVYHLQVSYDSSFTGFAVDLSTLSATSMQIGPLDYDTRYYWRVRAGNALGWGEWSQVRYFATSPRIISHGIALAQGWNMNSSFVRPQITRLDTLLMDILPQLTILKNGAGQVYWPAYSIDQIVYWKPTAGYQIYMSVADTLILTGLELDPQGTPDTLGSGWNMSAYLRNSPMRVDSAVYSIASTLTILKNGAGQVYWPALSINQIGNMKPGQGYQIYVTAPSTLLYPANLAPAPPFQLNKRQAITLAQVLDLKPQHFKLGIKNTGVNSTLLVEAPGLKDGDEIAVSTSSNQIVGIGVANAGKVLMAVWGENDLTKDKITGPKKGETLRLTLWSLASGKESVLGLSDLQDNLNKRALSTTLKYETDKVWIAKLATQKNSASSFDLYDNYPNPFNPSTLIKYNLPSDGHVTLKVFDILGREVMKLVDEQQESGEHQVVFDGRNLSSGMYFYSIHAGAAHAVKKMILTK